MSFVNRKIDFMTSERGLLTMQKLKDMVTSDSYHTESSYSANTTLYPNNLVPFVEKHMAYLRDRPNVDPDNYVANLRLMTKIR